MPFLFNFKKVSAMKKGANKSDQRNIALWYEQGKKAEEISQLMQIDIDTIKAFSPTKVKEYAKFKTNRAAYLQEQHDKKIKQKKKSGDTGHPEGKPAEESTD